eukprot:CAMPEP_0171499992 /NCGR_PEP_ID=MMETSP0958-20121227/8734_1 /TAXON_ID=87120 /ORGANISM="Aurantiochytrium limacinum, Strain ATCCMYA-1381" /LENGTH=44 /DNA_ID= /DNA_START= /DNA_END= /DNA_ORIENTATION=
MENVTKVSAALSAHDLYALHAMGSINLNHNGVLDTLIKSRPSTA